MSRKMVLATLLAAVVLPAQGQTQKTETKTVVLKAARIFDGKSNSVTTTGRVAARTLEGGKSADIVAVPGNPQENIRQTEHVFFVMKEGEIYKNEHAAAR